MTIRDRISGDGRRSPSGRGRRLLMIATAVLAVGAMASAMAIASLPAPRHAKIVRFESIGGVKLNMSKAQVANKWGAPDFCDTPNRGTVTCVWQQSGYPDLPPQGGAVEIHRGEVCEVIIRAGIDPDGNLRITRFRDWETGKGIGLGSTKRAARRAHGPLVQERDGVNFYMFTGYRGESLSRIAGIGMRGPGPCFTA